MDDSSPSSILQAQDVSKIVNSGDQPLTILSKINLSIKSGESVAITGTSGSGKSTLLGLLAGLDTPTHGKISLHGHAINEYDEDKRAKLRAKFIGFVFQSFYLLPSLTALENVMLPLDILDRPDAKDSAKKLLDTIGLSNRQHHYPTQLSGGEQQRVAIARAFITQPKILYADEPTGNLDSNTSHKIIELLFKLNTAEQTTLVIVTHDPQIAYHCQQHFILENGTLQQS